MSENVSFKPVNFKNILTKYLYHWPLFLLALIITLSSAVFYYNVVKPTYELRASILVKDVKKTTEEKSALQELDHSDESKIAENEVEILSSRSLISQVVNQLQLWVDYTSKEGFIEESLYKKSPVEFVFVTKESGAPFVLTATIINNAGFYTEDENGKSTKYLFKQTIVSKFGKWKLMPTAHLSIYYGKKIYIRVNNETSAAEKYQGALQVSLLNKLAPTIGLSLNDKDITRGKDFLNTLIFNYNNVATAEKNKLTTSTIAFIDKRLDSLTGELNHAEGAVEKYRSDKGLTDISSESKVYLENAQTNDAKLNDVNVKINLINGIENYINSPQNANNTPSTNGIGDASLTNLVDRLSQLQLQKAKMMATTPESNPIFESINGQIKVTKNGISSTVSSIKSSLYATRGQLQSFNNKFQSSIRQVPGQERQLLSVKRQQTIKEDLYVYLLQKREELSLSYTSTLSDARIIDNAYEGPVIWPQKAPLFAMASFIGFLIPLMLIYTRDNFKDKVLIKNDIEKVLNLPILGELPIDNTNNGELIDQSVNNVISEHLRSIRTKLNYSPDGPVEKGRVVLVTSSVSGEGKSFISSNLSTSLAFLGKKTILMELDLRKPQISKIFKLSEGKVIGLAEYLSSPELTVDEITQKSFYQKLDIIPSGMPVNNPAELLDSNRLETLITHLRTQYDYIIIDTSPVHLVTDALVISRLTDLTIYIVRQGVTNKSELLFIKELHEQNELKNIKIIFNGIQHGKYGYGNNFSNSYYNVDSNFSFKKSLKKIASRF